MERVIQILLIEDDHIDQLDVRRELTRRNILHKLIVSSSGDDALAWMNESWHHLGTVPDIILLDLHPKGMDGFEFLSALRKNPVWKDCKVFVLTISDDPLARTKAAAFNVSGYIIKPLRLEHPSSIDAFHLMVDMVNIR